MTDITTYKLDAAPAPVSELGEQPVSQPYRLLLLGEVRP